MKAEQLSQTAAFVAIKFYGLTRIDSYRSLFDRSVIRFYEKIIRALPAPLCYYHYWLKSGWVRAFYIQSEELLLPGDLMHIVARKWYIGRMVDELINRDYEQLVVLGAGFDHLAWHYSQQEVSCFELDAPYMTRLKQQFLSDTYPGDPHPAIIEVHFPTDNLEDILNRQDKIDPHKKTIVVAEGFFDYLDQQTVASSLATIQNYFLDSPALISTHFALDELSTFHRRVFKTSVNLVGEKLRFDTGMPGFKKMLLHQKFNISRIYDAQNIRNELHERINTSLPVLKGFYLLLTVSSTSY